MHNLDSYFEDCGCSGANVGGIAKIAGRQDLERDGLLFVGRTVFPKALLNKNLDEFSKAERAQLLYHVRVAETVLAQLAGAQIIPDIAEHELVNRLQDAGIETARVAKYMLPEKTIVWNGLSLSVTDESISIGDFPAIPLPVRASRGRRTLVIGLWSGTDTTLQPHLDARLGTLVPLSHASTMARTTALDRIEEYRQRGQTVVAHWTEEVKAGTPEHAGLAAILPDLRLGREHSNALANGASAFLPITHDSERLSAAWSECASCHEPAFRRWKESSHFRALHTLQVRRQSADLRCLPCHTSFGDGQSSGPDHLAAVTCASCTQGMAINRRLQRANAVTPHLLIPMHTTRVLCTKFAAKVNR